MNFSRSPLLSFKGTFLIFKKINKTAEAKSTLNQTRGMAPKVMSAPKMAVNPHIKTMKWRCSWFLSLFVGIKI